MPKLPYEHLDQSLTLNKPLKESASFRPKRPGKELVHARCGSMVAGRTATGGEMKRNIWSGTLALIVATATVTIVGQAPPTSQRPATTTDQPSAQAPTAPQQSSEGRITVVGCLQTAAPNAAGTSGTTASPPAATDTAKPAAAGEDAKFVLANAVQSGDTAATTSSPSPSTTYRLIANDSALMPHVGKKLELTGTIDQERSASSTTSSSPNASPKLRVEAGKVLAQTCTQ
jgi:hypothetical protein